MELGRTRAEVEKLKKLNSEAAKLQASASEITRLRSEVLELKNELGKSKQRGSSSQERPGAPRSPVSSRPSNDPQTVTEVIEQRRSDHQWAGSRSDQLLGDNADLLEANALPTDNKCPYVELNGERRCFGCGDALVDGTPEESEQRAYDCVADRLTALYSQMSSSTSSTHQIPPHPSPTARGTVHMRPRH